MREGRIKNFKSQRTKDHLFCLSLYIWPLLLWFTLSFLANYVYSLLLPFQEIDIYGNSKFILSFSNFKRYFSLMFTDGDLLFKSMKYSLIMYALNLVFSTLFNHLFAYLIFKKCFGHKVLIIICFIPAAVSSMVFGLCFQKFVSTALPKILMELKIVDYNLDMFYDPNWIVFILNFYMLWTGFTNAIIILPNAMSAISPELLEAGQIDGIKNMFQEMWHIVMPCIWGTSSAYIVTGVSTLFTSSGVSVLFYQFNAPEQAYNLGYYYTVLTVNASNETFYPVLAAGGVVMTFICAPLTFLVKRFCEKCKWSDN